MKVSGFLAILFLATTLGAGAQTPPTPAQDIAVKTTPASTNLAEISTAYQADQKSYNTQLQQARFALDQTQKDYQNQLAKANKELQDKLKADKHYTAILAQIDDLTKKLQTSASTAQEKFNQSTSTIQTKLATENAQINVLVPVVRKENDLPDGATYDPSTQKWTAPKK